MGLIARKLKSTIRDVLHDREIKREINAFIEEAIQEQLKRMVKNNGVLKKVQPDKKNPKR